MTGERAVPEADYWVLRVLGEDSLALRREYARLVLAGDLCVVSGELCEPIVAFKHEETAKERAVLEHQRTGKVHRVVLTLSLE